MERIDGWQLLANAIVKQAARDYERAICMNHKCSTRETRAAMRECEQYFKGDLIKMHTKLDGPSIMKMVRADCVRYKYDLKKLREVHNMSGAEDEGL